VLGALAMSTALVWAAGLCHALRKAEGGTPVLAVAAFGGGVLTAASMLTLASSRGRWPPGSTIWALRERVSSGRCSC
jgi:hypothetical protein